MLKTSTTLSLLTAGIILMGCGSTSKTSTDAGTTENPHTESSQTEDEANSEMAKITGSVPGTLIEAFCVDGSYYRTESDQNGRLQHPFSLDIPKNLECHLVMTTNENDLATRVITPISIVTPENNGSAFIVHDNSINLGYIDLAMNPANIIDANGDQVVDNPFPVTPKEGNVSTIKPTKDIMDSDHNGIIDLFEDDDEDGIPNREDKDQYQDNDLDGDGIKNQQDNDDDNDGLSDNIDRDDNNNGIDDQEEESIYAENNHTQEIASDENREDNQENNEREEEEDDEGV